MGFSVCRSIGVFSLILLCLAACGSEAPGGAADAGEGVDSAGGGNDGGGSADAGQNAADAAFSDTVADGFERSSLGADWMVFYPPTPPNDQVRIIASSDLGMGPGPQGFFLVNWIGSVFDADQYCEATIPSDVEPGWAHMVYVRWRQSDAARYGFAYNNDPSQATFGQWIFKYDGVPGPDTRIIASVAGTQPQPGDRIRVEVQGYTLRGYHNGTMVLEGTDTDGTRISDGLTGLAARWSNGNQSTNSNVKVWESWQGGSL